MKLSFSSLFCMSIGLALLLPTNHSQSQLVAAVDPLADMQALQTANDDLLKRQEATLKELTDITTTANEVRIFSRRG